MLLVFRKVGATSIKPCIKTYCYKKTWMKDHSSSKFLLFYLVTSALIISKKFSKETVSESLEP